MLNRFKEFALPLAILSFLILNLNLEAEDMNKKVFVHYMPWYSSKSVSGDWGWHWTMNKFNPEHIKKNGQREIASHQYPLIGPYDSNDPDALVCQVLLMKLAGINGVIIDWYGIKPFRDYSTIHRNTKHLIKYIKRAGLEFAICYEDQTVRHMVENRFLPFTEVEVHGQQVMQWVDKNWLNDSAYLELDGRPVVLVFGPQYFNRSHWSRITTGLMSDPQLFGLPHVWQESGMNGKFGWPPVTGGQIISPSIWRKYLDNLQKSDSTLFISVAFPAFHDIYQTAGVHDSYGFIDNRGGQTFIETFNLAWQSNSTIIQVATWNDYGEGTAIEPTTDSGYFYLEIIQRYTDKKSIFDSIDLRLPISLYQLRKESTISSKYSTVLDQATTLLFDGQCKLASQMITPLIALLDKATPPD